MFKPNPKVFKNIWKKENVTINPYQGKSIDKSLKISEKFMFKVPSFVNMLLEQSKWMETNSNLYHDIYAK